MPMKAPARRLNGAAVDSAARWLAKFVPPFLPPAAGRNGLPPTPWQPPALRCDGHSRQVDCWSVNSAAIRSCTATLGRGSRRQIQSNRPLRRIEVVEEIVDVRDPGEGR